MIKTGSTAQIGLDSGDKNRYYRTNWSKLDFVCITMTSIQATQNMITIQPLYKWDSGESQMTYLNLYPHKLNRIEYESQLAFQRVSSDFTQFFLIFTGFFAHLINPKGLVVIYIFQRLIHMFKDDLRNSRTKCKFQEFSRTKVKFKDFSTSVQTLLYLTISLMQRLSSYKISI